MEHGCKNSKLRLSMDDWVISLRNIDDESLCNQFIVRNTDEHGAQAAGLAATKRWKHKGLYWTVVQVVDYEGEI